MTRLTLLIVVALTALSGCTVQQQAGLKGELTKRDIYLRLMTLDQAVQFHRMEQDQRDDVQLILYCQEIGVYQKWQAVPPERQTMIRQGRLAEGMSQDEVRMAWGRPGATEDATDPAERQAGRSRELWSFDPTADRQGNPIYARQACFLDQKLLWFKDFRAAGTATAKPAWNWFGLKK